MSAMLSCLLAVFLLAQLPPPEVQAAIAKMRSGKPATSEEQKLIRDWMMHHSRDTDSEHPQSKAPDAGLNPNGYADLTSTPPDIQAIIDRAKQGHQPSEAELARMRSWSAGVQSHKDDIRSDVDEKRLVLERIHPDGGARSTVSDPRDLNTGTVVVDVQQHSAGTRSGGSHGDVTISGRGTYPVQFTIDDRTALDGGFDLQYRWDRRQSPGEPSLSVRMMFQETPRRTRTCSSVCRGTRAREQCRVASSITRLGSPGRT
jgi:hypothetical protein